MPRYDDDEPPEGTVLAALRWLSEQLSVMAERLRALEQVIGVPTPEDDQEWR